MDNLNDLKAIWLTAKTDDLLSSAEMLKLVKKFRNERLRKKLTIIFVALAIIVLLVWAELMIPSAMLTTRIGGSCTILACIILVFTNTRSLKRFIGLNDCSNKEFLEFLEQTRRNQVYYYKKTQVAGMVLSSLGLVLYLYQSVYKSPVMFIVFYAIAIALLLFLWLYIRPRSFKKQTIRLNETISKLENISHQIDSNE